MDWRGVSAIYAQNASPVIDFVVRRGNAILITTREQRFWVIHNQASRHAPCAANARPINTWYATNNTTNAAKKTGSGTPCCQPTTANNAHTAFARAIVHCVAATESPRCRR